MGNNIKFYDFYDSCGLIGSIVTLQIRIENVLRDILNEKLYLAAFFTAPAGILVKFDEVLFCPVIMSQLNALNHHRRLRENICFFIYSFSNSSGQRIRSCVKFLSINIVCFNEG